MLSTDLNERRHVNPPRIWKRYGHIIYQAKGATEQVDPLNAPVDSLASALALWTAVKPRALELAAQGPPAKSQRLAPLTAVLAPHFAPLAEPALAARDPDKCAVPPCPCSPRCVISAPTMKVVHLLGDSLTTTSITRMHPLGACSYLCSWDAHLGFDTTLGLMPSSSLMVLPTAQLEEYHGHLCRLLDGIDLGADCELPGELPALEAAQAAAAAEASAADHADVLHEFFQLQVHTSSSEW